MEWFQKDVSFKEKSEYMIMKFTNNLSVWSVFEDYSYSFELRLGEKVLQSFEKMEVCEAFVSGMAEYAKIEGELFKEEELVTLPYEVEKLRESLVHANREKEKAKQLAEKLIKGIIKNKSNEENDTVMLARKELEELSAV